MLINSCRSANFIALLRYDESIRATVPELVKAFEKLEAEDSRGTRLFNLANASRPEEEIAIIGNSTLKPLDAQLYTAFVTALALSRTSINRRPSRNVSFVQKMAIRGVRYTRNADVERDSEVIFRRNFMNRATQIWAGQIVDMFTAALPGFDHTHGVVPYVAVKPYLPLPESSRSEFIDLDTRCRSFTPVGGYLSSAQTEGAACVIHAADIVCHFAKLTYEDEDIIHVLQLGRVGSPILLLQAIVS